MFLFIIFILCVCVFDFNFLPPILQKHFCGGAWEAQSVKGLPSAQVMTPRSWDRTPGTAPCSAEGLFLLLPLSLSLFLK